MLLTLLLLRYSHRMLTASRRDFIESQIRNSGAVAVSELAEHFGVSTSTIRRDLNELSRLGRLNRVRGGGTIEKDSTPFEQVQYSLSKSKDLLGVTAANLIKDGEVVILDIGTTVAQVAKQLRHRRLTVVTASLAVVDVLRDSLETELIVLGGVLRNSYLSLVGGITELALQQISADVAVLGASGVSNQGFVLDTTGIEVPIKKAIMAASDRNIFVLAEDKFPGTGVLQICHPGEVDTIVTTRREPSAGLEQLRAHSGKVIIA